MTIRRNLFITLTMVLNITAYAQFNTRCDQCCKNKGCIQYCDSSAGRFVCGDGDYSSCYCTRHAVMDLQKIQGCCLWQGGVFKIERPSNLVICNDGSVSEMCSIQHPVKASKLW